MDTRRIPTLPEEPEQLALADAAEPSASHAMEGYGPKTGLVAIALVGVFAFLDLYVTQPMLPMLRHLFHTGEATVALTVGVAAFGVALSAPWMGALAQRLGRKRVVVASILVLSVPVLLTATAPGLRSMIFWRFVQGLVLPGIFATAIAYITEEWQPRYVPVVMSIYVSGTVFGGFLGRLLGGLVAARFGWRAAFVVLGCLILVGAGVIARWLPREVSVPPAVHHKHIGAGRWRALLAPKILAVYVVGFGMLFCLVGVFTYVTFYLADPPFSLSTEAISALFTVYLIGLVVTPLVGLTLPKIGLRVGVALASLTLTAGALITLVPNLVAVLAGLALVASGVFVTQAAAASYLRVAAAPHVRAIAAGAYLSAYYLGGTFGGEVPAYVWQHDGWRGCVLLVCAMQVVVLATAWFGWE